MRKLREGDRLILTDKQTLRVLMEEGQSVSGGLRTTVIEANHIHTEISTWSFYKLEHSDLVLVVQDAGGEQEFCIYFPIDGIVPGNRADLFDNGGDWIFNPPEPDSDYEDLTFAHEIPFTTPDGVDAFYTQEIETVWGEDSDGYLAGVTEWRTEADCENPYVICTEIGGSDNPEGGLIEVWQGCEIDNSRVELMEG